VAQFVERLLSNVTSNSSTPNSVSFNGSSSWDFSLMVKVNHSLNFVTELDETHPVAMQLLSLPESMQVQMLESMLKEMLVPFLQPEIDRINEGGSYAILKVAK
jgi:hypothetical protein